MSQEITLTRELLRESSNNGAWNLHQLQLLGVWPTKVGWLETLIGKRIPLKTWECILALKGVRPRTERRNILLGFGLLVDPKMEQVSLL